MNILIAANAFKHALDAEQAATAISRGFMQSSLDCNCTCFPIGDGGDGTGELIIKKNNGQWVETQVSDPLGRKISAVFGLMENNTAVIEMANASGLRLLENDELNPLEALSYGTGEQIKMALDKGARRIIIGMGGSATVDGGTGMLKALGIRFLNDDGKEITNLPEGLQSLSSVDTSGLDERMKETEITVLCDVENLLLGDNGSAAVFGPQKGAKPAAVATLDTGLARLSKVAFDQTGIDMAVIKYGGTAGGAAAGLHAFLNAKLVNGIDHFLELTNFDEALKKADLVITGEGSIDEQTLQGKGPFGVARRAKEKGLPVIAFAGRIPLNQNAALQKYFDVLLPIGNQPSDLPTALKNTAENLARTACMLGNILAMRRK